jgi:hypothetical protein
MWKSAPKITPVDKPDGYRLQSSVLYQMSPSIGLSGCLQDMAASLSQSEGGKEQRKKDTEREKEKESEREDLR